MENALYESVTSRFSFLDGLHKTKVAQYEKAHAEVTALRAEKDVLEKTEKALKFLIEKLAKKDLTKMDKLITYGINTVLPDRDIKFKTEIEERGKKVAIDLQTWYNGHLVDPQTRSSVQVIESFLLRLLCIMKLKKAPLLLLDETFSAVHVDYIENVNSLIGQLASKLKMDVLLVTHNSGFGEVENSSYRILLKDGKTVIEKKK